MCIDRREKPRLGRYLTMISLYNKCVKMATEYYKFKQKKSALSGRFDRMYDLCYNKPAKTGIIDKPKKRKRRREK